MISWLTSEQNQAIFDAAIVIWQIIIMVKISRLSRAK